MDKDPDKYDDWLAQQHNTSREISGHTVHFPADEADELGRLPLRYSSHKVEGEGAGPGPGGARAGGRVRRALPFSHGTCCASVAAVVLLWCRYGAAVPWAHDLPHPTPHAYSLYCGNSSL